jgi:hypothetical protein
MNEKPMLFSSEMVKAILAGRKTQTRRAMNPQPLQIQTGGIWMLDVRGNDRCLGESDWADACPYGQPGDRLWVKETSRLLAEADGQDRFQYRADGNFKDVPEEIHSDTHPAFYRWIKFSCDHPKQWRPSIFMPRWASRITLEITHVRVERVNQISKADVIAEGTPGFELNKASNDEAVACYQGLWESINGKPSWKANPWVWVVALKEISNS